MLDLDGVLWRGGVAVPGAADAVAALEASGASVLFVTNNAARRRAEVTDRLRRLGFPDRGEVLTSAMAAAAQLSAGERVLVCAGDGVREAVEERGAVLEDGDGPVDAVIVGMHPRFDYRVLARASDAVRDGSRFIATNTDATYPTAAGLAPGAGAIVAAVATAAGRGPSVIAGKPHGPMAELVRARTGAAGVVVGDRPDTDGRFAAALGLPFVLVLSGVTTAADAPFTPAPQLVAADLAEAVETLLRRRPSGAGPMSR